MRGAGFDSAGVWDHLHWLCHTLVIESQSLRINFSSGTLIIFNHPAEMKARVIDMTSTDSMRGSLHFLSPPLTALTDEFNKRGTICLSKNRTAKLSAALLAWFQQYWWIYHSVFSQKEPILHLFFFLITDSVRSLPMELGAMTQGKLHFHMLICVPLNGNSLNAEMHLFRLICLRSWVPLQLGNQVVCSVCGTVCKQMT